MIQRQIIRVLGPHQQLLETKELKNAELYPQLSGDNHARQSGGVIYNGSIVEDCIQLRCQRQFAGKSLPNTSAPIRDWRINERSPSLRLAGTWLFAGFLIDHFGHFIADNSHRLWPLIENQ